MPTRLYYNPECSKSRTALDLLRSRGIEPERVDYRCNPPSVDELRDLVRLLGTPAAELVRMDEADAAGLALRGPAVGMDDVLQALHAHPHLMQRPVFEHAGRAVIARPPERVLELLEGDGQEARPLA